MYDGMFILEVQRDTVSSFLLTMGDDIYPELRDWFEENGGPLLNQSASSRKFKTQTIR